MLFDRGTGLCLAMALLGLSGCANVVQAPGPGKTPMAFLNDQNICMQTALRRSNDANVYVQCMNARGEYARIDNGAVAPGATGSLQPSRPQSNPSPNSLPNADLTKQARAAHDAHNYGEAFPLFRKIDALGEAGVTEISTNNPMWQFLTTGYMVDLAWARTMLGYYYEHGLGIQQDYTEAATWYEKAIKTNTDGHMTLPGGKTITKRLGDNTAILRLGLLYAYGLGVPQDRSRARALWASTGRQGDSYIRLLDNDTLPSNLDDDALQAASAALDAKEKREQEAREEQKRREQAALAAKYSRMLDKILLDDSVGWSVNKYDEGSVGNISKSSAGTTEVIRADYQYNDGQKGWVEAHFSGNKLDCLTFWDFPGVCRRQNDPVEIRAEIARRAAEAEQQRAAWAALPAPERQRRCQSRCASAESECHAGNFDRGGAIMMYNGFNMGSLLMSGIAADNCDNVRSSCMRSCVSGN